MNVQGIYPSQYTGGLEYHQQSSQAHCLDLVLTFVQHMARRVERVGNLGIYDR
jgi:hypothetical protein